MYTTEAAEILRACGLKIEYINTLMEDPDASTKIQKDPVAYLEENWYAQLPEEAETAHSVKELCDAFSQHLHMEAEVVAWVETVGLDGTFLSNDDVVQWGLYLVTGRLRKAAAAGKIQLA